MAKISRRDFLKLFLVAAGGIFAFFLQKLAQPVTLKIKPTRTHFQPPVTFLQWGQDNLVFVELTVPYQDLR
jgi:hypothetical protein